MKLEPVTFDNTPVQNFTCSQNDLPVDPLVKIEDQEEEKTRLVSCLRQLETSESTPLQRESSIVSDGTLLERESSNASNNTSLTEETQELESNIDSLCCKSCNYTYESEEVYYRHQILVHWENYCSICKHYFPSKKSHISHLNKAHATKRLSYIGKVKIRYHDRVPDIYDENNFCNACEYTFSSKEDYQHHLKHMHAINIPKRKKLKKDYNLRFVESRRIKNKEEPIDEEPLMEPIEVDEEPLMEHSEVDREPLMEHTEADEEPLMEHIGVDEEPLMEYIEVDREPLMEHTEADEEPLMEHIEVDEEPLMEHIELDEEPLMEHTGADNAMDNIYDINTYPTMPEFPRLTFTFMPDYYINSNQHIRNILNILLSDIRLDSRLARTMVSLYAKDIQYTYQNFNDHVTVLDPQLNLRHFNNKDDFRRMFRDNMVLLNDMQTSTVITVYRIFFPKPDTVGLQHRFRIIDKGDRMIKNLNVRQAYLYFMINMVVAGRMDEVQRFDILLRREFINNLLYIPYFACNLYWRTSRRRGTEEGPVRLHFGVNPNCN